MHSLGREDRSYYARLLPLAHHFFIVFFNRGHPMLHSKPILIVLGCAIAIVVGVYLVDSLYLNQNREEATPTVTTDKPGPTATGQGDVGHEKSHPPVETQTETYRPMTSEWLSEVSDIEAETRRLRNELIRLLQNEELASMSYEERLRWADEAEAKLARIAELNKEWDSLMEQPIPPPKNN